jgi:hypothetical protein
MERYKNLNGESGVHSYEIRDHSIVIEFTYGGKYLYDYEMPGKSEVEEMKRLAEVGTGLATYINQNVRKRFARKLN